MRIKSILLLGVSILLLSVSSAKADSLISGSGTWGSGAPTTPESAPGATWSFSFLVSDPATDATPSGGGFLTQQVSGLVYMLNGASVAPPLTLMSAIFFDSANFGGFDLNLSDGNILSFFGPQIFGGCPSEDLPCPNLTFIAGNYSFPLVPNPDAPSGIGMNDNLPTGSGTVKVTSVVVTTPEPGTLSLLGFALFGLLLMRISKG